MRGTEERELDGSIFCGILGLEFFGVQRSATTGEEHRFLISEGIVCGKE